MLLVFAMQGCKCYYDVSYEVENLTDETVVIEMRVKLAQSQGDERDYSLTVAAGKSLNVNNSGGNCSCDYVPADLHDSPDEALPVGFVKFEIYVENILMPDELRYRKNWDYTAKELRGVYTLRITKEKVNTIDGCP